MPHPHNHNHPPSGPVPGDRPTRPVLLVGDSETADQLDNLTAQARKMGTSVADSCFFKVGAVCDAKALVDSPVMIEALGQAVRSGWDIWCPWSWIDLGRAVSRDSAICLTRFGLALRTGQQLVTWPMGGHAEPLDVAVAIEVARAEAPLAAVAAAAAAPRLIEEVTSSLRAQPATSTGSDSARALERENTRLRGLLLTALLDTQAPKLPSPGLPFLQRRAGLCQVAQWAVEGGATRAGVAELLNAAGHTDARAGAYTGAKVSALLRLTTDADGHDRLHSEIAARAVMPATTRQSASSTSRTASARQSSHQSSPPSSSAPASARQSATPSQPARRRRRT